MKYFIDPNKIAEFEEYARFWLPIVRRMGGEHHGYYLPGEGPDNVVIALFSFQTLAAYEEYRRNTVNDIECQAAIDIEVRNRSILSYERSFMRPLIE